MKGNAMHQECTNKVISPLLNVHIYLRLTTKINEQSRKIKIKEEKKERIEIGKVLKKKKKNTTLNQ